MSVPKISKRLLTLDYLRGYFIVIIIIDHLERWPSIFGVLSGHALLWVTAAEGFVIISGLLVGYIRGYKNRHSSMQQITSKLLKRAGLLYLWVIISTIVYAWIVWNIHLQGGAPGLPFDRINDWRELIVQTLALKYAFVWVYFLKLYAIFLAASPIAVWLMRRGKSWLVAVISLLVLVIGWQTHSEAMQWQALFFVPSAVGYYLEDIRTWWLGLRTTKRQLLTFSIWIITGLTIGLSVVCTFYPEHIQSLATSLNNLYAKDTISIYRILTAFLWFTGLLLLFARFEAWIQRWVGWLLGVIGSHSLTAYIIHGLVLCLLSYLTLSGNNIIVNSLMGASSVLLVWVLLKIPLVHKVIPS